MTESQPKLRKLADGKNGKRPFGPFLILATAILLLLVLWTSDPPTREISEDRFWYELFLGHVREPQVSPPSRVQGKLVSPEQEEISFRVTMPISEQAHERIRNLSAKRLEVTSLTVPEVARSVEGGAITPVRGYAITALLPVDDQAADGMTRERQHFFLDYFDQAGAHYAEVVGTDNQSLDMLSLQQILAQSNAPTEMLSYKLADGLATKESNSLLMWLFTGIAPILLFAVLFWFLFLRQMRGQGHGLLSFGRSRAVLYNKEKKTGVTFDDVAGIDEAKDEVREIIEFLKNPSKFQRLGGRIPRGVLLVGPPGTGKTLLAKAIAGEADVPFLSISGSDFVEMFVGVGASRVRDLFKQAKESAPCIVFLDEIDAVGRKRGTGMGGGHDEREQTLNAILVEMDGFGTDEGIIVCAATNRPDVLDPALLRPGRFDREVVIDLPDIKGREKILQVHTRNVKLAAGVELLSIARGTPGFSGAELAALVNEAALSAAMHDRDSVTQEDFEEARDKVRFGRQKKSRVMDAEDKQIIAYHEAGHAVANVIQGHSDPVHKVTIIPRGMALGATMYLPEKDEMHISRKRAEARMIGASGGRVAEEMFCNDITAGAASDIQYATHLARLMVTRWGMSERLGPVNFADRTGSDFLGAEITMGRDHSEATVREIDEEVQRLVRAAQERARQILTEHRAAVERVASALLRYETLSGDEVSKLVHGTAVDDLRPAPALPPPVPGAPARLAPEPRSAPKAGPRPYPGKEGLSPA